MADACSDAVFQSGLDTSLDRIRVSKTPTKYLEVSSPFEIQASRITIRPTVEASTRELVALAGR